MDVVAVAVVRVNLLFLSHRVGATLNYILSTCFASLWNMRESGMREKRGAVRLREWQVPGGEKQNKVSVYVSNLPATLDKFGLIGIFCEAGRVLDSYIPVERKRGSRSRYGFVRFGSSYAAARSIQIFNNKVIRGNKISVSLARTDMPRRRVTHSVGAVKGQSGAHQQKEWRVKRGYKDKDIERESQLNHQERQELGLKSMKGRVNEDFVPWLDRSLVCTTQEPRDTATLTNAIVNGYGQCTKICTLSGFKFILTFQSEDERDAALENHEELDMWFTEIKKWDRYERCTSRKVWLEVVGVPPHGWVWENFQQIAEVWGCLISLSKPILRMDAFDSMKLLIETDIMSYIDEVFILTIEDLGFRINVREVSIAGPMFQTIQASKSHHDGEDAESNYEVPGFEDVVIPNAEQSTPARVDPERHCSPSASQEQVAGKHTEDEGYISNFEKESEEPNLESQQGGVNQTHEPRQHSSITMNAQRKS